MVKPSGSIDLAVPPQGTETEPPEPESRAGTAILAVLLAATCWSFIGIAYTLILDAFDVSPLSLVSIRATTSAVALMAFVMLRPTLRSQLRILRRREILVPLFGAGFISGTGFYIALVYTYAIAGVAVGTVLLYLAPSLVAFGSWIAFKYRITRTQKLALVMSFLGVVGVSGLITGGDAFSPVGLILGITSAICYGSYSLFGQQLLRTLHPVVVVAVTGALGSVGMWVVKLAVEGSVLPSFTAVVWIMLATGVGTTLIPLLLYTWGLSKLGAPRASLLTTIEPVLAVALAFIILNETLTVYQLGGGLLVVSSVLIAGLERAAV